MPAYNWLSWAFAGTVLPHAQTTCVCVGVYQAASLRCACVSARRGPLQISTWLGLRTLWSRCGTETCIYVPTRTHVLKYKRIIKKQCTLHVFMSVVCARALAYVCLPVCLCMPLRAAISPSTLPIFVKKRGALCLDGWPTLFVRLLAR